MVAAEAAAGQRAAPPLVVVVGAGASGLVAALAAATAGARVLVLDRAPSPGADDADAETAAASNTARSTGLIPAAGSSLQRAAGVLDDSAEFLAEDILRENGGCDAPLVRRTASAVAGTIEWLMELLRPGSLVFFNDFLYPGHGRMRMVGPPSGYGRALQHSLAVAVAAQPLITVKHDAKIEDLVHATDGGARGVRLSGGECLEGACVVLATNGFGANEAMVREHLGDSVASGIYLGSPLNTGEAFAWASRLGAATERMGAYQGHASVVAPTGPLVTWGVVVNGGVLVNREGRRFGNELVGYSSYSQSVMAQPGAEAVEVFAPATLQACRGTRLEEVIQAGRLDTFDSLEELCLQHGLPLTQVSAALEEVQGAAGGEDSFGRRWPSQSPWDGFRSGALHAIRVRAALFHTQGGLRCDASQRVLRGDGMPIPGLFAAGGTAAGLSGEDATGYLSGNGLLHAVVSGRWAGQAAAALARGQGPAAAL